jgi:hypothetical protein
MSDLSEMEREAQRVAETLARLSAYLRFRDSRDGGPGGTRDARDATARGVAEEGLLAAERVLAYLRELRGAGDGAAAAYPTRLGPWREWSPGPTVVERNLPRAMPRRWRGDPGE